MSAGTFTVSWLRARALARAVVPAVLALVVPAAPAADALVAVAANFAEPARRLEARFEAATPHRLEIAIGSTGALYAQIVNGAPYDVLLAADRERPLRLERGGRAVPGSRFTYANGQLTLWSSDPSLIAVDGAETLAAGRFRTLAMANPDVAPYGAAARQLLADLRLLDRLRSRIVTGQSVGQVYAMVATGNADLGFVARSQVLDPRHRSPGSRWDVPARLHAPIPQDAVLLARAAGNPAAIGFLRFLRSGPARELIAAIGYRAD